MFFLTGMEDGKYKILDTSDGVTELLTEGEVLEGINERGLSVNGIVKDINGLPLVRVFSQAEIDAYTHVMPLREAIMKKDKDEILNQLKLAELGTSLTITRCTTTISTMSLTKYESDKYMIENKETGYSPYIYDIEKATDVLFDVADSITSMIGYVTENYRQRVFYKQEM